MGAPDVGDVVLLPFPFSDLSQSKVRPAVCLADGGRGDRVLCQITSKAYGDKLAIPLSNADFASGTLHLASFARPGKLFTANQTLIVRRIGRLHDASLQRLIDAVVALFRPPVGP